jgi:hypothetical protein
MTCIDPATLIEDGIDRILTQYRESPNLIFLLRTYMAKAAEVHSAICALPEYFDIETAVGDQLTLLGKRMGFPRCHCVCIVPPVFGFACEGVVSDYPIVGFCGDGTWVGCGEGGISEICISDDEMYRKFLKVRRYQMLRRYSIDDLTVSIRELYGEDAVVLDAGQGRVVIAPFRELTQAETSLLQVVPRVLPVAPGIRSLFHFGIFPVFGFGQGWGGFCEEINGDPIIVTEGDQGLWSDDDVAYIAAESVIRDADWMCPIDTKPYSC